MLVALTLASQAARLGTAAAATDTPQVHAPPAPRLPWLPRAWRYVRGGEVATPDESARFWDRALLRRSVGASNYAQMRRLLDKLNAGEPIIVAAVGSSVVQDHGGTFHSSLMALRAAVASPHPYIYGPPGGSGGPAWVQAGWLSYFMRAINETWPHPGHMLVNAGGWCGSSDNGANECFDGRGNLPQC
jgi:hypothetical protein